MNGYVDIDQLGMRIPSPSDDPANTLIKAANLAAVLETYRHAGAARVIISGVMLPSELPAFEAAVSDAAISRVRLYAARDQLHARFLERDGSIEGLPDVDHHAEAMAQSHIADAGIDTTSLTVAGVVAAVLAAVPEWAKPIDESAIIARHVDDLPTDADESPPRVLLLGGPHAVRASNRGLGGFSTTTASGHGGLR